MEKKEAITKYIYFIGDGKHVKIGTSNSPKTRLATLQTSNPKKLELIYSMPGNKSLEKSLHSFFNQYHVENEWFRYEGSLFEFINYFKMEELTINKCADLIPSTKDPVENKKLNDDFEVFELHEDHEKILTYLKLYFIKNLGYESIDKITGPNKSEISIVMATVHKFSKQKTNILLKELYGQKHIIQINDRVMIVADINDWEAWEKEFELIEDINDYHLLYNKELIEEHNIELEKIIGEKIKKRTLISNNDKNRAIIEVINELDEEYNGKIPINTLEIEILERYNINKAKLEQIVSKLKLQGVLFEPEVDYLSIN